MKICVTGYYFDADFIECLHQAQKNYPTIIISHADDPGEKYTIKHIPVIGKENIGLEFSIYDYYIKNLWDGSSSVLFCHDDIHLSNPSIFNDISRLTHDCAYIFRDQAEDRANGGKHGRAIFCSPRFINFIKGFECECKWIEEKPDPHNRGEILPRLSKHTGFWFDPNNKGHICGKPPKGVRHYNEAIYHFHWTLGRIRDQRCGPKENWPCPKEKMDVVNRVYFSEWEAGRRNLWRHKEREQRKYTS